MIPSRMNRFLNDTLPQHVRKNRLIKDGPLRFLEFGPLHVE